MKRVVSSLFLLSVLIISIGANAQSVRRTVLLEEGTNWSCGPCATWNPTVEEWLAEKGDSVIHLCYHPHWPGADDPMYLNDIEDNEDRVVTYYKIDGVPEVSVSGREPFFPPSIPNMQSRFDSIIAMPTPIALSITRSQSGITVNVSVTVRAVGDVATYQQLMLRVAAVERYVNGPGPNGEKKYVNAMRAMMPNSGGTALSLKKGDSATFNFSYDIDASYQAEKMFEVAFVQNDATHEVLQAASSLESFQVTAKPGAAPMMKMQSQTASAAYLINNTTSEDLSFTATYKALIGKDWTVLLNGQSSGSVSVRSGDIAELPITVTAGTGAFAVGIVSVWARTQRGDTISSDHVVKFVAPSTKIAFVDVSQDSSQSVNTLRTLTTMKLQYVPLKSSEAIAMNAWDPAAFPTIIVEANKWILTGADKAGIAAYLQNGGHLLVHGGEIAYGLADSRSDAIDQDVPFLENVLHASYLQDSAGPRTVRGIAGDVISDAFATQNVNIYAAAVDAPNQPDEIAPANGSVPIFYFGIDPNSQVAGVRWDSAQSKMAYLSFGLQNLATTTRQAIITTILNWFNGPALGNGSVPGIMWEPGTSGNFGSVVLGTSVSRTLTVVDSSGTDCTVQNAIFTGADASEFLLGTFAFPATVKSHEMLPMPITWKPVGGVGARSATLTVNFLSSAQETKTITLDLRGTAVALADVSGETANPIEIAVWPNPIVHSGSISITPVASGSLQCSIVDPLGRVWFTKTSDATAGVPISVQIDPEMLGLSGGVYYVTVTTQGATTTREMVVSR